MSPADPVPPLPPEDHACRRCRIDYRDLSIERALAEAAQVPDAVRRSLAPIPAPDRHTRPEPGVWSIAEYVCHLRDVYATYTIRLHRTRTEDRPVLEPMLNDLRARRFRYNDLELGPVLDQLDRNAAGFADEAARFSPQHLHRVATRKPTETRTAAWMIRQVMHEGRHHVHDLDDVGRALARR